MKIIGLTGSIGMGKSVTAALLRQMRLPVFDSDLCVHGLLHGRAREAVIRLFPSVRDATSGHIDRKALGAIIFNNPDARRRLEALLHPMVWEEQRAFIAKARRLRKKEVILDIPLLFETGREAGCNAVMCVTAPAFLQRLRVLGRAGMTDEKFIAIMSHQIPDPEKRRRATWVIPTGLGRGFTLQKLKKALRSIAS